MAVGKYLSKRFEVRYIIILLIFIKVFSITYLYHSLAFPVSKRFLLKRIGLEIILLNLAFHSRKSL